MRKTAKKLAHVRVAGPDQKGIIARVTTFLFENDLNIEDIDQRILEGFLVMNMVVDVGGLKKPLTAFRRSLAATGRKIGMETEVRLEKTKKVKNAAILVTKESHCLEALVRDMKAGRIQATPKVILSNRPELASLARKLKLPFHHSPSDKKKDHEAFLIQQIQKVEADVIILARYMQILSPEFCFRYEDRIINIHPSLLPSFPGALPYAQAFNKGVEVAGVTAHFATTDLDQGPIITQEAFKVDKRKASLEEVKQKGRDKEAKVLCRAVKLFCSDELVLRRGKVVHSKKEHEIEAKTKEWF